jgi:hypothetical protein
VTVIPATKSVPLSVRVAGWSFGTVAGAIASIAGVPVTMAVGVGTPVAHDDGKVAPTVIPAIATSVAAHGVADGNDVEVAERGTVTLTVGVAATVVVDLTSTAVVADAVGIGVPVVSVMVGVALPMAAIVGVGVAVDGDVGSTVGVAAIMAAVAVAGRRVAVPTVVAVGDGEAETPVAIPDAALTGASMAMRPLPASNAARPQCTAR